MNGPPDGERPTQAELASEMVRRAMRPNLSPAASVSRPVHTRPRRYGWVAAGTALLVAVVAAIVVATRPSAPALLPASDEATLLATQTNRLAVFRLAPAPKILIALFPSLDAQGLALNRIGAFVEKAGLPRDHVLTDEAMQAALAKSHDTNATFYYGHDYRAADLARFFRTAQSDNIPLHPEETEIKTILQHAGLLANNAVGALISLPPISPEIDAAGRATILHHEASHGAYFTDPAYAAYTHDFWTNTLTAIQRDHFRRFLADDGYDPANDDLIQNETQAYLIHTPDPRFFRPANANLTDQEAADLRETFLKSMPDPWLRNAQIPTP